MGHLASDGHKKALALLGAAADEEEDVLPTCCGAVLSEDILLGKSEELIRFWIGLGKPALLEAPLVTKIEVEAWD